MFWGIKLCSCIILWYGFIFLVLRLLFPPMLWPETERKVDCEQSLVFFKDSRLVEWARIGKGAIAQSERQAAKLRAAMNEGLTLPLGSRLSRFSVGTPSTVLKEKFRLLAVTVKAQVSGSHQGRGGTSSSHTSFPNCKLGTRLRLAELKEHE